MHKIFITIFIFAGLVGCSSMAPTMPQIGANSPSGGNNRIHFTAPADTHWLPVKVTQDTQGYMQVWQDKSVNAAHDQGMYISFVLNLHEPLMKTMQTVAKGARDYYRENHIHVKVQAHVVTRQANQQVFTLNVLGQCKAANTSRWEVFHLFNQADGQYALVYHADPCKVPAATRAAMQSVVAAATIVPLNTEKM